MKILVPILLITAGSLLAEPPPLAKPPSPGAWEMVLIEAAPGAKTPKGAAAPAPEPPPKAGVVRVESRTSNEAEERVEFHADGNTRRVYRTGAVMIAQTSPGNPFYFLVDEPFTDPDLLFSKGFYGLDGLSRETESHTELFGEIECRMHKLPRILQRDGETVAYGERTVWVDAKSGNPVAIRIGDKLYAFTIRAGDPGPIRLVPNAMDVWQKHKQALEIAFGAGAVPKTAFDK